MKINERLKIEKNNLTKITKVANKNLDDKVSNKFILKNVRIRIRYFDIRISQFWKIVNVLVPNFHTHPSAWIVNKKERKTTANIRLRE